MNSSGPTVSQGALPPTPLPPSTSNDRQLSQSLRRLSLTSASATALPPSPQVMTPQKERAMRNVPSSPAANQPRSPFHRSPSAMSVDNSSRSPALLRKTSMTSVSGINGATPPRYSTSRRTSLATVSNGPGSAAMSRSALSSRDDAPEQRRALTAASIAKTHFQSELDLNNGDEKGRLADTIVVLHDSCFGHRYSRPRTSRTALSTIVERPERIHASILGLSVAYVRLGERHASGRYPLHPEKDASHIPTIPFQIRKTTRKLALSSAAVTNVHGVKWMEELKIMCDVAESKLTTNGKELERPEMNRSPDQGLPPKLHEGDLYLCSESLNAMEGALGAVCEGVDAVFEGSASGKGPKRAFVAIRPPGHHCSASYPSGFCWLNNVHVGIAHAAISHGLTHAAIIDFDLHHGDGSQTIAWEHNARAANLPKNAAAWKKTSIGYFSLHDINSYPCEMGDEEKVKNASLCIENAHGQNIWNVHLQPWKNEAEFWDLYETRYSTLLDKTRVFLRGQTERIRASSGKPKAAIFLSAGFDASEWESSGMQRHKVNVPTEFYARLTRDVVKLAAEEECSVSGRVISVLEGGYSDRALSSGVLSHISGLAGSDPLDVKTEIDPSGLGYQMAQLNGTLGVLEAPATTLPAYDPDWWALTQLKVLDATINPPPPPSEPKKPKDLTPPTYSSPTESFTAKIVGSPKIRRSTSNLFAASGSPRSSSESRAPSPPPPDVDWATAAHELSKLLIPTDRQTKSCLPEELAAEATRARRDRQSILTLPATAGTTLTTTPATRMALRDRKTKPLGATDEEEDFEKQIPKTNRRKTMGVTAAAAIGSNASRGSTPKPETNNNLPTKASTRRLSLTSTAGSMTSDGATLNGNSRASSQAPATVSTMTGSSQSVRPGSSLSSRGNVVPPVTVKKSRTVISRPETAKPPRGSRKSPGATINNMGGDGALDSPPLPNINDALESFAPVEEKSDASEMASLTSSMKRIKISLNATAAKSASSTLADAKKVPVTKFAGISKPAPAPLVSPAEEHRSDPATLPISGSSMATLSTPEPPITESSLRSRVLETREPSAVPLPASSPPGPTTATSRTDQSIFIPYQPEGPAPTAVPRQEPLMWLEPNASTPSPLKRTQAELPVFTATSAIPFAVPAAVDMRKKEHDVKENEADIDMSIWDVPETPKKV